MSLNSREIIARNIATMLRDGDFVNLGVGIPTMVGNFIPEGMEVIFHGENGTAGLKEELAVKGIYETEESLLAFQRSHRGDRPAYEEGHKDLVNASGIYSTLIKGACCFDSIISFAIARGGHLDMTVLGGMQVDEQGNLANWKVPGKREGGMGGAMDLVAGTKKVVIAMEHCDRNGNPKILKKCTLPLTGAACVTNVVTELCMIDVTGEGLLVTAMAPGLTKEELQAKTEASLLFAEDMKTMLVD